MSARGKRRGHDGAVDSSALHGQNAEKMSITASDTRFSQGGGGVRRERGAEAMCPKCKQARYKKEDVPTTHAQHARNLLYPPWHALPAAVEWFTHQTDHLTQHLQIIPTR